MILIETQPGRLVRSSEFRVDPKIHDKRLVRSVEDKVERASKGADLFPVKRYSPEKYEPQCGFS